MHAHADSLDSACDLRFGQVGLACVRVLHDDPDTLRDELARRVASAPALFARTAVVLDLSHLMTLPDDERVRALLGGVRDAGMLPVGLAYGTSATEGLATRLDLPLIAKFRAVYERQTDTVAAPKATAPASAAPSHTEQPSMRTTLHRSEPVRSGQQVYAQARDMAITASVANGAELIADGSIHVYGRLSGRALAGALGDEDARIFCTDFRAELVSIAGHYRVFEEIPKQFEGKPVQCWLDGEKLHIEPL